MIARSSPNWPEFIWHHRVHIDRAREHLCFWLLGFHPIYQRDAVEAGIEAACAELGAKSVITYELFGVYDVLLRVWLPEGCSVDRFSEALAQELAPVGLTMADPFVVQYVVRHWMFADEETSRLRDPEEYMLRHLSDIEIREVETSFPEVRSDLLERLRRHDLLATFQAPAEGNDEGSGIKFIIVVQGENSMTRKHLQQFEEQVVAILDAAKEIGQRSLYTGSGFGHFLILGRVPYLSFHAIHSQLISQINAAVLREPFAARTYTYVSGQRGYHVVREALTRADDTGGDANSEGDSDAPTADESTGSGLKPGDVYNNRFEILLHLGGGGYAEVYKVFDPFEGVPRALKIFRSSDPEVALREINALRKIRHPNVVEVIWGDRAGPQWFMVSEFISGRTLQEIENLGDDEALLVVIQVLHGLQAVHPDDERIEELESRTTLLPDEIRELLRLRSSGLVHRDIKPANIMVSDDRKVKLVDFNIASPARDTSTTHSGTPGYQAPDAGLGQWEPSDDLFACGVVLYELLTGEHPYADRQPRGGVTPIDPLMRRPDLRPSLADVVVRACASIRSERYRTAREMCEALENEFEALRAVAQGIDTQSGRIGRALQRERKNAGYTIDDLAKCSGVDAVSIQDIEEGKRPPTLREAMRLADELHLELHRFFEVPVDAEE